MSEEPAKYQVGAVMSEADKQAFESALPEIFGPPISIIYENYNTHIAAQAWQLALAHRDKQAEPVQPVKRVAGWIQFIDGVQTQNFARDENELKLMDRLSRRVQAEPSEITYQAVYTAPPAAAINEQMLEVVKRYLSNLEVQEFEVVRYDRCGDFAHHVCSSCSARKFPNGEKEAHEPICGWFYRVAELRRLVAAAEAEKAKGGAA